MALTIGRWVLCGLSLARASNESVSAEVEEQGLYPPARFNRPLMLGCVESREFWPESHVKSNFGGHGDFPCLVCVHDGDDIVFC